MALKTFNPTTPSQRHLVIVDRRELWKGKPVKALTEGLKQKGGRNNTGRTRCAGAAAATSGATGSSISSGARTTRRRPSSGWNTTRTAPPLSR